MNIGRATLSNALVVVVNTCCGDNPDIVDPNFKVFIVAVPGIDGIEIKPDR